MAKNKGSQATNEPVNRSTNETKLINQSIYLCTMHALVQIFDVPALHQQTDHNALGVK